MIFFTSDTHFGHANIIKYCKRPFSSVKEMDETMIANWNDIVAPGDLVYHLGDFAFGSRSFIMDILGQLNGRIHLIFGSHDKDTLRCEHAFTSVNETLFVHSVGNPDIFMAHHCHKVWPLSHYGSWHLFGHSHGTLNEYIKREGKLLDVGVDCHNFTPLSLIQVGIVMTTRPNNFNYVHKEGRHG